MDVRTEVKTFRVNRTCSSCNVGVLHHAGPAHRSHGGTQYEHVCQKCGRRTYENRMFPAFDYEEVPG